eukprot:scaffold6929_cov99-Cylindrotheca_fusiformis.AAC.7
MMLENKGLRPLLVPFLTFLLGWSLGQSKSSTSRCPATLSTNNDQWFGVSSPENLSPVDQRSLYPLEHSPKHTSFDVQQGKSVVSSVTDSFTPFHNYMTKLGTPSAIKFDDLPLWDTWLNYFEAYNNHMARFRGKGKVVFMEIGVQSGGKIALLRKYFGPGLVYIGIDINPSTRMFETQEDDDFTAHIEIGDSTDPAFWKSIREKYPHVDIFLDDGGHTMEQQKVAIREMLPHVQSEGLYMCEDLATSWHKKYGGVPKAYVGRDPKFLKNTMVGLVHQTLDWFMAPAFHGANARIQKSLDELPDDMFSGDHSDDSSWWKVIPSQVKHIHYYNQIVVYEKGQTYKSLAWVSIGKKIPYMDSGEHQKVNWKSIVGKLDGIFGESLLI